MPTAKATVNNTTIASATNYQTVEGNIYFPPDSISREYFSPTDTSTFCSWKGDASYYTVKVDGTELKDAAWYYQKPFEKAEGLKDWVAFCELSFFWLRVERC